MEQHSVRSTALLIISVSHNNWWCSQDVRQHPWFQSRRLTHIQILTSLGSQLHKPISHNLSLLFCFSVTTGLNNYSCHTSGERGRADWSIQICLLAYSSPSRLEIPLIEHQFWVSQFPYIISCNLCILPTIYYYPYHSITQIGTLRLRERKWVLVNNKTKDLSLILTPKSMLLWVSDEASESNTYTITI